MNVPCNNYHFLPATMAALFCAILQLDAGTIFEDYSPYHYIRVMDEGGLRILKFNDSRETQMSLTDPMKGHFEYTEFFHMPWLWNTNIQKVLMLGLGGGSIQRAYHHYYTNVTIDTAEMDPMVITVAKEYFTVKESPRLRIHQSDGRVFLKRSTNTYDVILADAYTTSRYGSSIPPHLTTVEFFSLANEHMTTNGVFAYNVIGQMNGWRADIMGALYRTMREVFPQVYLFPANQTLNVVMVGTRSDKPLTYAQAQALGAQLVQAKAINFPNFMTRLRNLETNPPRSLKMSPLLTDDHAPVESLMRTR